MSIRDFKSPLLEHRTAFSFLYNGVGRPPTRTLVGLKKVIFVSFHISPRPTKSTKQFKGLNKILGGGSVRINAEEKFGFESGCDHL